MQHLQHQPRGVDQLILVSPNLVDNTIMSLTSQAAPISRTPLHHRFRDKELVHMSGKVTVANTNHKVRIVIVAEGGGAGVACSMVTAGFVRVTEDYVPVITSGGVGEPRLGLQVALVLVNSLPYSTTQRILTAWFRL